MQYTRQHQLMWVVFIISSLMALPLSYYLFSRAIPLVNISLTMNRSQALEKAEVIHRTLFSCTRHTQDTAFFYNDSSVQLFVELEGGGKEAFKKLITDNIYHPYRWLVRQFEAGNPEETQISFTPSGRLFGFEKTLSENCPGAALSSDQARALMLERIQDLNIVDLSLYELVEYSQHTVTSGRIDHSFTFERPDIKIGEATYRILIQVSGDVLTKVHPFINIPESFAQRYRNMRSNNEILSLIASSILYILYIFIFCIIGLFLLYRSRVRLIVRPALYWAAGIAVLSFLSILNEFPSAWFSYNTAHSPTLFIVWYILHACASCALTFSLTAISFLAAENFTRLAFPTHLQFWKIYGTSARSSLQVVGRTVGGYLLVPLMLVLTFVFYYITLRTLGWWSPLQATIDPNILSNFVPWFTPAVNALRAGFWEECIFRAVPLSIAVLIGKRFGHRRWWIGGALILQALVFGAAHADYATQPAYARIVELIIPSLIFGLVYLRYGLLPVIITHTIYDVILMALPLFVAQSPGMWIQQFCIIIVSCVPLIICLLSFIKNKGFSTLPLDIYNKAYPLLRDPSSSTEHPEETHLITLNYKKISMFVVPLFISTCILVTLMWKNTTPPPLTISKKEAITIADTDLKRRGIILGPEWTRLATARTSIYSVHDGIHPHLFIWQTEGSDTYHELLTSYLSAPYYCIRYIKMQGSMQSRQEEYGITVAGDGTITRFIHQIPENQPRRSLCLAEAQEVASTFISSWYSITECSSLKEISARSFKFPERVDWVFVFEDTRSLYGQLPEKKGSSRICVMITGDRVSDSYRFIHVPEKWIHNQEYRNEFTALIDFANRIYHYFLILIGLIFSLYAIIKGYILLSRLIAPIILMSIILLFNVYNEFPSLSYEFTADQSLISQIFLLYASFIPLFIFRVLYTALVLCAVFYYPQKMHIRRRAQSFILCCMIGIVIGLIPIILNVLIQPTEPTWPLYISVSSFFPYIGVITSTLITTIAVLLSALVARIGVTVITQHLQEPLQFIAMTAYLISYCGFLSPYSDSLIHLLLSVLLYSVIIGASYYLFLWADIALVVPMTGGVMLIRSVHEAARCAYPSAIISNSIGAMCIIIVCWIIFTKIYPRS